VNGFAAFIAQLIVFFTAMFFFLRRKAVRLALAAMLALSVYSLLFSFSRGAYFASLAGLSFMALYKNKKLLLGLIVLVIAWQLVLPVAVRERIDMTYDANDKALDPSAEERVSLWRDAIVLIESNPIWGSGFDTYQFMHRVDYFMDTHNYYLKVLVEMGITGLLLLLAVLGEMFRAGFRLFRSSQDTFLQGLGMGFAAMVICSAVSNFFGDRWTYLQVDGFIWILLGCVLRAQQIAVRDDTEGIVGEVQSECLPSNPLAGVRSHVFS